MNEIKNGTEIEAVESDLEAEPSASGLVVSSPDQLKDILTLADNVEKMVSAHIKIRTAILKLAQPGDWVIFGSKAEIGFAGANRIGSTLGVSYLNWSSEKITGSDENGEWYRWEYQCDAVYAGRQIRVYGRAGSRDKFFGYEDRQWKQLANVNEGNIKQAGMRAAKKEGVKDLFGLHHLDPEFLKKSGISLESAGGHTFKSQEKQVADTLSIISKIEEAKLDRQGTTKSGKAWTLYKITLVEGDVYSTFSSTEYEKAVKAKAEGKEVAISYEKDDRGNNKITAISPCPI